MQVGDKLPSAELLMIGPDGPASVEISEKLNGRKVVLFGLPGAFTGTCTSAHMPSFVRTADALRAKGVDEIICISVNDPFVLDAWADQTGAKEAGITVLGDPSSAFTKAIGMNWTAPPVGFYDRCQRFASIIEDGEVKLVNQEEPGVCDTSGGEAVLDAL